MDLNAIGRMKHLKDLCISLYSYPLCLAGLERLSTLPKLRLHVAHRPRDVARFMTKMASVETMEYLEFNVPGVDDDFIYGVNRFRNLHTLKMLGLFDLTDSQR